MEPITHLLTGACLARAGLNRKSALAATTLILAAEAPDIDVITEFGGRVFGFAHHRGITHTFIGIPLMGALVVLAIWAVWRLWHRKGKDKGSAAPRWGVLFWLACLAGLSHLLLDFTNSYGVRPFMPLSYRWYSWDIAFIYEPVLWVILVVGLVLPSIFGLVDTEIGARKKRPRGRSGAVAALILMILLWGLRDYQHRRALEAMNALTYRGENALRLSAYPYPTNPFRWYGVVETHNFFQRMDVDSRTPEVDPQETADIRFKPEETPATLAAKKSYLGKVYFDWAQYPVTEAEALSTPQSGHIVRFYDLRYMYPRGNRAFLTAWVRLDSRLNVLVERFN